MRTEKQKSANARILELHATRRDLMTRLRTCLAELDKAELAEHEENTRERMKALEDLINRIAPPPRKGDVWRYCDGDLEWTLTGEFDGRYWRATHPGWSGNGGWLPSAFIDGTLVFVRAAA